MHLMLIGAADPYPIVRHPSRFMVLEPGDLIDAGTPPGVVTGSTPTVRPRRAT